MGPSSPPHSSGWQTRLAYWCAAGAQCRWSRLEFCAVGKVCGLRPPQVLCSGYFGSHFGQLRRLPTLETDASLGLPCTGYQSSEVALCSCGANGLLPVRLGGTKLPCPLGHLAKVGYLAHSPTRQPNYHANGRKWATAPVARAIRTLPARRRLPWAGTML